MAGIFVQLFIIQAGVTWLYALPQLSKVYNMWLGPYTFPIVLPLTQVAMTGIGKQLS